MRPIVLKLLVLLMFVLPFLGGWVLQDVRWKENTTILTNISSFSAFLSSVLIAIIGVTLTNSRETGVALGRINRLRMACYYLLLLAIGTFAVSTLSIEITLLRSAACGMATGLLVTTLLAVLGMITAFK